MTDERTDMEVLIDALEKLRGKIRDEHERRREAGTEPFGYNEPWEFQNLKSLLHQYTYREKLPAVWIRQIIARQIRRAADLFW